MCDYQYPDLLALFKADPIYGPNPYCKRKPSFWVQSLLSTHNMHACPHHLARIVRDVSDKAAEFDICKAGTRNPDSRYAWDDVTDRMTRKDSNYAYVTVKVYTPAHNN